MMKRDSFEKYINRNANRKKISYFYFEQNRVDERDKISLVSWLENFVVLELRRESGDFHWMGREREETFRFASSGATELELD